jgi:photosystem II stability/assembly factor-like uncharacterized protein
MRMSFTWIFTGLTACSTAHADAWLTVRGPSSAATLADISFADTQHGFAAGWSGGNGHTDDGGFTWSDGAAAGMETANAVLALSADSALFARNSLYRTVNGGRQWDPVESVPEGVSIFDLSKSISGRLVMLRGLDIWTGDGTGMNWQMRYSGDDMQLFFRQLRVPTADTFFALGGRPAEGHSVGHMARSRDGGLTWNGFVTNTPQITSGDFVDADHGLVATLTGQVYVTDNGGDSFSEVQSDLPGGSVVMDLRQRADGMAYAVTIGGVIYRSADRGQHWSPRYVDDAARAFLALSLHEGGAMAVGNDGLIVYEDELFADGSEPLRGQ